MPLNAGVVVVGSDRIDYFMKTVDTIIPQLMGRPIIFVLDFPLDKPEIHQKRHTDYILSKNFGTSRVSIEAANTHLGLGKNMIRARDIAFIHNGFNYAFIFEDDMLLAVDYLSFCEEMMIWATYHFTNVGACQGWLTKGPRYDTPYAVFPHWSHFWGYLMTRVCWNIIKKDLYYYRDYFLRDKLYKDRPQGKIMAWKLRLMDKQRKIHGTNVPTHRLTRFWNPGTGQDAITAFSMCRHGFVKLVPGVTRGFYIGENGEHFRRDLYIAQGFSTQSIDLTSQVFGEFHLKTGDPDD